MQEACGRPRRSLLQSAHAATARQVTRAPKNDRRTVKQFTAEGLPDRHSSPKTSRQAGATLGEIDHEHRYSRRHRRTEHRASIGTAYADSSGGTTPNTFFNQLPGVAEKPPVQNVPAAATTPDGTHAYVTQSSHGTWLYRDPMVVTAPRANRSSDRDGEGRHHCRPFSL